MKPFEDKVVLVAEHDESWPISTLILPLLKLAVFLQLLSHLKNISI